MEDILYYQDANQYNEVDSQIDSIESGAVYEEEEEISENELQVNQSDVFIPSDNVVDDLNSTEVVSVNSIIPEGTVINNHYSVYVSGNEVSANVVSSNIMDKPISEYTVQESLSFFSIVFALGVGLVILINKGVFRWN